MSKYERSLKNFFLNPKFQLRFMGIFLGLFVLTTISAYSTTYLFFWNLHRKAIKVGIPEDHVFHQFLSNQKTDMDLLFIGLAVFNLILLLVVGFVISHRIAGPLNKAVKHLKDPESPEVFRLRETDFFQELVVPVNDVKARLKK